MLVMYRKLGEGLLLGDAYQLELLGVRRGSAQLLIKGLNEDARRCLPATDKSGRMWCREGEFVELANGISISARLIRRGGTRFGVVAPESIRISRLDGAETDNGLKVATA